MGLLGADVRASLSPLLHGAAAIRFGQPLDYRLVSVADGDFAGAVGKLFADGALGANVTIPFKAKALELASRATPVAALIGAANVLTRSSAGLIADNTDGSAILRQLSEVVSPRDLICVVGTGGVARAALWAGRALSSHVLVAGRNVVVAQELGSRFGVGVCTLREVRADVVISAVPGGAIDPAALGRPRAILDLAYSKDGPTELVQRARSAGIRATDGRGVLAEQAALAYTSWTGSDLPETRKAMECALGGLAQLSWSAL